MTAAMQSAATVGTFELSSPIIAQTLCPCKYTRGRIVKQKQSFTNINEGKNPPFWRVRRKDDPDRWLRTFDTEQEARSFARKHAVAHCCDMHMARFGDPIPVIQKDEF
jgi:hypothetical protein